MRRQYPALEILVYLNHLASHRTQFCRQTFPSFFTLFMTCYTVFNFCDTLIHLSFQITLNAFSKKAHFISQGNTDLEERGMASSDKLTHSRRFNSIWMENKHQKQHPSTTIQMFPSFNCLYTDAKLLQY